jgi:hypothetical protein
MSIDKSYKTKCLTGSMITTEHRYVMEQHLGRELEPEEIIHHINGDRKDNRIENLRLMKNQSQHLRLHRGSLYVEIFGVKRCPSCGRMLAKNRFRTQHLNKNIPTTYCKQCQRNKVWLL